MLPGKTLVVVKVRDSPAPSERVTDSGKNVEDWTFSLKVSRMYPRFLSKVNSLSRGGIRSALMKSACLALFAGMAVDGCTAVSNTVPVGKEMKVVLVVWPRGGRARMDSKSKVLSVTRSTNEFTGSTVLFVSV